MRYNWYFNAGIRSPSKIWLTRNKKPVHVLDIIESALNATTSFYIKKLPDGYPIVKSKSDIIYIRSKYTLTVAVPTRSMEYCLSCLESPPRTSGHIVIMKPPDAMHVTCYLSLVGQSNEYISNVYVE